MQTSDVRSAEDPAATGAAELDRHSLMDTFITRRSRRFALGNTLYGSGLAFQSQATPVPLSLDEEAVIAFAATGVTGHVNGELPYAAGRRSRDRWRPGHDEHGRSDPIERGRGGDGDAGDHAR